MEFKKIINPKTGRKVSIYSKLGKKILTNYINQLGGHNGPCAINSKGSRCKKSKNWDHTNCELSEKGNCKKKNKKSTGETKEVEETKNVDVNLDIQVDKDELMSIIGNFIPEEYSHQNYMGKALIELKKIKYDPNYISQFDGKPINIKKKVKELARYLDEPEEDLLDDPYVHSEALKEQILDKIGDETFWSDLIE